jgi:hypothetical protein
MNPDRPTYYGGYPIMLRYVDNSCPVTEGLSAEEAAYRIKFWQDCIEESAARKKAESSDNR